MHDNHHLQYCRTRAYSRDSIVAPCDTKWCAVKWINRPKTGCLLAESTDGAFVPHIYIFSGWISVLVSCIHEAKPYVDSEPFSWWFTHKQLPMVAETTVLLIARQVFGQYSPNRARSRHFVEFLVKNPRPRSKC